MAAPDIGSGTAEGLLTFCDYLVRRGIAPASAVNPWKSAAKQVFTRVEESDDFGDIDVRTLDVDDYMTRFVHKSHGEYKPDSLNAYGNRFRKAVEAYRGYLADPVNWRPRLRTSPRRPFDAANGRARSEDAPPPAAAVATTASPAPAPAHALAQPSAPSLIDYPFPLRSGQIAHLHLPSPLEKDDADRLTQFLRALIFERQAQLPAAEPADE